MPTPQKLRVLMTGGGAPGAAGIIKCIGQEKSIELLVADADPEAIGKHLVKDFFPIPKADEAGFTSHLLKVCRDNKVDLLLPLVSRELIPLSLNKHLFAENGTRVLISPPEAIELANNKSVCYRFLDSKGVPVPQFHVARTTEEFIHAAYDLGHPQTSFCFKPSVSNGSRGFRTVSDSIDESDMLFHEKPYNNWITYAHALKILSSKPFPELLVSECLPGEEYSVDCLAREGKPVLVVPRLRKKMVNGITVQGCFVKDEEIIDYCKKIIEVTGLHGNIGIQVKRSSTKKPLLLEINPRVQGTIVAGLGAGINLPLLAIKQEMGQSISSSELEVDWGTCFSRHWTEVFYR